MPVLKVQFNHPGSQKKFGLANGYRNIGGRIIREWNNDSNHYRKFLLNNGDYLDDIHDSHPKNAALFFWGEWEGNSYFTQINNSDYSILPNGIHEPIHSIHIRGIQNTDPYVFGKCFKYCICKQTGDLCNLDPDSLIIFGSVFPSLGKFYVDTVFVVKSHDSASNVHATKATGYTNIYREETLEQLTEYLGHPYNPSNVNLYHSQSWWDNKEYFSFVPCKLNHSGNGFERLFIDLSNPIFKLSSNPTGKSFLRDCNLAPQDLWEEIAAIANQQGFSLAIRLDEPSISTVLDHIELRNDDKPNKQRKC